MTATQITRTTSSWPLAAGWLRLAAANLRRTPMTAVLLIASWLFFVWAALYVRSPTGTLEAIYADHLRHARYALSFPNLGLGIYWTAARDVAALPGVPGNPVWPNLPYLYPPLAILVFSPLAIAIKAGVPVVLATKWFIIALLTFAHISAYMLNAALASREGSAILRGSLVTLYVLTSTFWSLNAQYEAVPALFVILSGNARTTPRAVVLGLVAIALKFQSLLIVPFLAWRVVVDIRSGHFRRPAKFTVIVSVALALSAAVSLFLLRNDLSPAFQNRIGWHDWSSPHAIVAAAITAWVVTFSLLRSDYGEAVTIAFVYAALARTALFQAWYTIIIIALVCHYRRPARWETYMMWYIGLILALQSWPNPIRFWSLITAV